MTCVQRQLGSLPPSGTRTVRTPEPSRAKKRAFCLPPRLTTSQPSLQAYYLSLLKPVATEKVLEIGTGSGYLTALLALMVERVYSVERVRELSKRARKALYLLGV